MFERVDELVEFVNQLIITVFAALATGGAVVPSQYLGAKKPEQAAPISMSLAPLRTLNPVVSVSITM